LPSAKFRKVGERPAYRSSLLDIAIGTFEGPDGQHFDRDIVHHPGAVVIVPLDDLTGEVVFVRQYRAPLDIELLEIPAGKRDVPHEPTEVTAARELTEETGLAAGSLELIGHFYSSPGFCDEELWCYLGRDLRQVGPERHGVEEEHMTLERYPFSEALQLARSGQIKDAKTIVGLFLAQGAMA
jgi:ADP-ribose pyrophosphatase